MALGFRSRSPPSALLFSLLFVCVCVLLRGAEAVNVGEPDARLRHLRSAASGSSAADSQNACPTATTIEVSNATSASAVRITTGSSSGGTTTCKSEVVTSVVTTALNADKSRVLLDVHEKGIVVVKSVPTDVQIL